MRRMLSFVSSSPLETRSPAHRRRYAAALLAFLSSSACGGHDGQTGGLWSPGNGTGNGTGDGGTNPGGDGGWYQGGNNSGSNGNGNGTGSGSSFIPDECGANNPAGLTAAQVQQLQQATGPTSGMRFLYPYDGTVFPRGLQAPLLMWEGGQADAVYVHVHSSTLDYKGCLKPTANGQLQLPQTVWEQAGMATAGPSDPFEIELTTLQGSTTQGPIKQKIVIAQATLSGSIFYNSYNAQNSSSSSSSSGLQNLLGSWGVNFGGAIGGNGAVLRIKPGSNAEIFARQGTCTGCHSVSANGTRLIARELQGMNQGSVYSITPQTPANPNPSRSATAASFVGLSPDGSVYVGSAAKNNVGPLLQGGIGTTPDTDAVMYETDTGIVVSGTGIPTTALMPTFSPDSSLLALNDYANGAGHSLSLMSYDSKARKASGAKVIYNNANLFPGWPFVLPDNGAVIFALGDAQEFDGHGVGISGTVTRGPSSDLHIVDVKTGTATVLAKAMGFNTPADASAGNTYLPFGSEELHQAYYPTVSPVASGGYYWVFFDSMRHYGNQGVKRQLWGTAVLVSPDGTYKTDPSSPPFYISGQDGNSANHRAFTALDPCLSTGSSCSSGVGCCSSWCVDGECTDQKPTCSNTGGGCSSNNDCCTSGEMCINGFCSTIIL